MTRPVPHSAEAEEAVLGVCLLTRPAVEHAVGMLRPEDFYVPAHAQVFAAIGALWDAGSAIDVTTVAARLADLGSTVDRGALVELVKAAPASYNVEHYARIVIDHATRRALIAASERTRDAAYDTSADLADVVTLAREQIDRATVPVGGSADPDVYAFVDAGPTDEPWVIPNLLQRQERLMLVAAPGAGKANALDEVVPTPGGWARFGDLRVGDQVYGRDGAPCHVVALGPVFEDAENTVTVRFADGTGIVAHRDHEWVTTDRNSRARRGHQLVVRETREIEATLRAPGEDRKNHAVPLAGPLLRSGAQEPLPITPYLLGAWLGDGNTADSRLTLGTRDADEIEDAIAAEGHTSHRTCELETSTRVTVPGLHRALRLAGLLGAKRIPPAYLRASGADRLALLRGLMDTDGHAARRGRSTSCELTLTCAPLAADALELLRSLGIRVAIRESDAVLNGRVVGRRWRMGFRSPFNPFTVEFKASRWSTPESLRAQYHYIAAVEPHPPVPLRCIQVDSPDGTYLIGPTMIPTHNSTVQRQVGLLLSAGLDPFRWTPIPRQRVAVIDFENPVSLMRRKMREMAEGLIARRLGQTSVDYDPSWLRICSRTEGIDLVRRSDQLWLADRCAANAQAMGGLDLLCIGPIYKMDAEADYSGEGARRVQKAIDSIRMRHGCAVIMETHAPHESFSAGKPRTLRPAGSRGWLNWPEFCRGLEPHNVPGCIDFYDVRAPRDLRPWPRVLRRDAKPWPWVEDGWEQGPEGF